MSSIKVWDPFIRIFHWSLVAGFVGNALIIEDESKLHEQVGYVVVVLLAARILWGLIGPRTARFAAFWPRRTSIREQITDMATHRRRAHLGHSPLGALMIFNLIATLGAIGATGYMMTTDMFWGVDWVEEAHEALVNWAWFSIALHVSAVIWESRRTGVNLPRAMITGRKRIPDTLNLVK